MGLVFRAMLGVTVSQILSNHSIVTVNGGKTTKALGGCSWTNKITRHFRIGLQNF